MQTPPAAPCTFSRADVVDGHLSIETVGLTAAGQAELHMVGVPEMLAPVAERYLGELAHYATQQKKLTAEETIGVPTHFGANFARLVTASADGVASTLRVVDIGENAPTDGPPLLVLATELFEEAFRAYQRGEMQLAAQLLETSIETYAGTPGVRDLGANVNHENFRAHLLRFTLTQRAEHLEAALERSVSFQIEQLGAPMEILSKLLADAETIRVHATLIREVRLATWDQLQEENPDATAALVAPLPQPHLHTNAEGGLDTALSLVPVDFADSFYRGVGREVVASDEALDLVVAALARHRENLSALVLACQEGSLMWSATEMERGPMPPPIDRATGLEYLITSVLAQLGALAAVGLEADARRRWFRLEDGAEPTAEERKQVTAFAKACEIKLVEIVRQAQSGGGAPN